MATREHRIAAILHFQHGINYDIAFLGPWYIYNTGLPLESYWRMVRSVNNVDYWLYSDITSEHVDLYLRGSRLGANPWQQRKGDLLYCRVCYRMPIRRLLRCFHCYHELERKRLSPLALCQVPGCSEPHTSAGRCRRHYQRAYRYGTIWMPAEKQEL